MRYLILIVCCLLLVSCTNNTYEEQINQYNNLIDETTNYNKTDIDTSLPFDIEVYFEKLIDEETTYRVIIDNPKEQIKNIKVIAIHNYVTKDIYPTSGIFEQPLNLIPNIVDLKSNNVKGIVLVGYIDYDGDLKDLNAEVRVLIKYDNEEGTHRKIYYEYHK